MITVIEARRSNDYIRFYDHDNPDAFCNMVVPEKGGAIGFGISEIENIWHDGAGDGALYNGRRRKPMRLEFTLAIGARGNPSTYGFTRQFLTYLVGFLNAEPFRLIVQETNNQGTFLWRANFYLESITGLDISKDHALGGPPGETQGQPLLIRVSIASAEASFTLTENYGGWIAPAVWARPESFSLKRTAEVPTNGSSVPKDLIHHADTNEILLGMPGDAPCNFALYLQGPFDGVGIYTPGVDTYYGTKLAAGQRRILDFGWGECYDPDNGRPHPEEMVGHTMALKLYPFQYIHLRFFGAIAPPTKNANGTYSVKTGARLDTNPAMRILM